MRKKLLNLIASPRFPLYLCSAVILIAHFFFRMDLSDDGWFREILAGDWASLDTWLQYLEERYRIWTSRLLTEGIMIVLLRYPILFRILNAAVAILALFLLEDMLNPEHSRVKNWILALCLCLYPVWLFKEVGWAATSLTYLWTLTAAILACRPAVLELQGREVRTRSYVLSLAALVFGAFQEQVCAILVIAMLASALYRCFAQKKIPVYQPVGLALCGLMMVYTFTCPGNDNRTVLEAITWFPEHPTFSLMKKVEIGFSTMIHSMFLEPTLITPVFCLILAVAVCFAQRSVWKRVIGFLPLVFSVVFGLMGWLLRDTSLPFSYFYRSVARDGTGFELFSPSTWLPDLVFVAVLVLILAALRFAVADTRLYLISVLLLGTGAASRIAMGLSPTVWASGERTCIFLYVAMDLVIAFLLLPISERLFPERVRTQQCASEEK